MNTILKKVIWLIMVAPAIYLAFVWNQLPKKVAIHFDLQGNPDRYGSKTELLTTCIVLIVMNVIVYLVLTNIYRIDPKKNASENKNRLHSIAFAVAALLSAVVWMVIYSSMQGKIKFSTGLIFSGVGILLAVVGNYLPNMKPNYFAGLRLPWALESEENWRRTHRLAGKLFFAGGILLAVICLFTPPVASIILFFTGTLIMIAVPCFYSYRLYKRGKLTKE
ncbi:MAG: SdpI family protein [Chitinophagaceae bacterium]|nr:SdpI family protein [Chitinophagaceae bacterium]